MVIATCLPRRLNCANHCRVEKYRPDTLEDVSGHQDILTTINKFVDTNVSRLFCKLTAEFGLDWTDQATAIASSPSLWTSRYWQNVDNSCISTANLRQQEYAPDGVGAQCQR